MSAFKLQKKVWGRIRDEDTRLKVSEMAAREDRHMERAERVMEGWEGKSPFLIALGLTLVGPRGCWHLGKKVQRENSKQE